MTTEQPRHTIDGHPVMAMKPSPGGVTHGREQKRKQGARHNLVRLVRAMDKAECAKRLGIPLFRFDVRILTLDQLRLLTGR